MGIPRRLREMGYKVLTLSNLPAHSYDLSGEYPNMYWPFGQHILSGARIVKESKNLYAIYLTNHGCGPDTILSHYFKEEMKDKPYLHLEVDEHASNVGVMTRIEAFVDSLKDNRINGETDGQCSNIGDTRET
jgi:predicted nucleotide-binding protein (sugar kinase/HSP70/actin superfamily)